MTSTAFQSKDLLNKAATQASTLLSSPQGQACLGASRAPCGRSAGAAGSCAADSTACFFVAHAIELDAGGRKSADHSMLSRKLVPA